LEVLMFPEPFSNESKYRSFKDNAVRGGQDVRFAIKWDN